jgi:anti-sigma regulatory factor (Ser/Thr protein kinase)
MPKSMRADPAEARPAETILEHAFDRDSLGALRAAVATHAARAGLAPGRATEVVLVTHELAANAVRHGAGRGRLRIWRSRRAIHCEVTDGQPPEPGAVAPPGPDAEPADADPWPVEHGHGLWVARHLADQARLISGPGGTTAVVSFALRPPG